MNYVCQCGNNIFTLQIDYEYPVVIHTCTKCGYIDTVWKEDI